MFSAVFGFMRGLNPMTIFLGAALAGLIATVAVQGIKNNGLERELEKCELQKRMLLGEVAIHHAKVTELLGAVAEQNAEVRRLGAYTDAIEAQAEETTLALAESRMKRELELESLTAVIGQSCADGISLIDKELRL